MTDRYKLKLGEYFREMMDKTYTSGKELAKEFGISRNTVTTLRKGGGGDNKRKALLNYMEKKLGNKQDEPHIEYDKSYIRDTGVDQYIIKNRIPENIDEFDEEWLRSNQFRGMKFSKETLTSMLKAFRVNIKDEWKGGVTLNTPSRVLKALFKNSPFGVAILEGEDLRYVEVNKILADMNGAKIENHIGKKLKDVLPDEEFKKLYPRLQRVLKHGKSLPMQQFEFKDLHLMDYLFPVFNEYDEVVGVGAIVINATKLMNDITEQAITSMIQGRNKN